MEAYIFGGPCCHINGRTLDNRLGNLVAEGAELPSAPTIRPLTPEGLQEFQGLPTIAHKCCPQLPTTFAHKNARKVKFVGRPPSLLRIAHKNDPKSNSATKFLPLTKMPTELNDKLSTLLSPQKVWLYSDAGSSTHGLKVGSHAAMCCFPMAKSTWWRALAVDQTVALPQELCRGLHSIALGDEALPRIALRYSGDEKLAKPLTVH